MPSRTNLTTGIPSSKVKYSRLSSTDDGYIDLQFKKSPPKIPYKAIALATVLFLIGAFLIIIGSLLLAGYISKGGQTGLFLSWSLASWCSCQDSTTCALPTMHPKATGVTLMMTFQTLMTDIHLSPEEKSHRWDWAWLYDIEQKLCLGTKDFCNWQMFNKTVARF